MITPISIIQSFIATIGIIGLVLGIRLAALFFLTEPRPKKTGKIYKRCRNDKIE